MEWNTTRNMCLRINAFALSGRTIDNTTSTQGVAALALGYVLIGPSARPCNGSETNVPLNVAVSSVDELTERQRDILKLIASQETIEIENVPLNVPLNTKSLAEYLGLSRKTIQRELNWLQEQGTICRVGSKKNGHWEIVKDNPNNN